MIATMPFYRIAQKCRKWISNSNDLRSRRSIRLGPYGPRMCPGCSRVWQNLATAPLAHHWWLWSSLDAKDPKKGYGTLIAEKDWLWYETWLNKVREHCAENAKKNTGSLWVLETVLAWRLRGEPPILTRHVRLTGNGAPSCPTR
jgi:hypothetical protein